MIFKSKLVFRRFSKSNKHNNQVVILCRFCLQHLCEVEIHFVQLDFNLLGKGKANKFLGRVVFARKGRSQTGNEKVSIPKVVESVQ